MTLRCKHCGAEVSITERETAQIAKDWDRRMPGQQQASMPIEAVCGECWALLDEQQVNEAAGRRVQIISAADAERLPAARRTTPFGFDPLSPSC